MDLFQDLLAKPKLILSMVWPLDHHEIIKCGLMHEDYKYYL
jgi:hypothetical protein